MGKQDGPRSFKRITEVAVYIGTIVFSAHYFRFVFYGPDKEIVKEHFAAIIGLPSAAIVSLFLVLLLEHYAGTIEFECLYFKFKGASGPIVLWVFCFLAIAFGMWLLW